MEDPRAADKPILELTDVTVDYGRFRALHGVTLRVPPGATGLVGRNGAGKSTLLRLAMGLVAPTSGTGTVLGRPLGGSGAELRRLVGYMPENDAFIPGLRGIEQTTLAGELCGLPPREALRRAHEALAYTGLGEERYRPVERYSAGMRQRLKLAAALVHDPPLLLLDEPTVGLDPPGRRRILELIRDLAERWGKSLIVCTHLLGDIEDACAHVAMMERGRVLETGPLAGFQAALANVCRVRFEGDGAAFRRLLEADGVAWEEAPRNRDDDFEEAALTLPAGYRSSRLFAHAVAGGAALREFVPLRERLADRYHAALGAAERGALDGDG